MNPEEFRKMMRYFPAAVSVVTTEYEDNLYGLTASAITSLSLEPPCLLVCVNHEARSHNMILQAKKFCMNLLHKDQAEISNKFAGIGLGHEENPFDLVSSQKLITGAPALQEALLNLDCELVEHQKMSTHTIFIGQVVAAQKNHDKEPLLYLDKTYGVFQEIQ